MMPALRVFAAGLAALAIILAVTVLSSFLAILQGFAGDAVFPADCALVFGAAISGTSSAGPAITRRVGGAAALWKEGKVRTLILTGGKGDAWRMSEGAVMRKEAIRDGVDGRDILIEDSARSTKENLANSRILVEKHCQTVVAVSDRYHLGRIRLLAARAGWGSLPTYGVDEPDLGQGMRTTPLRAKVRDVVRELAAYLYYALGADAFLTLDEYDDHAAVHERSSGALIP
jgi:uncharacterized SAM-binding protein YcdF (DUF218 family)